MWKQIIYRWAVILNKMSGDLQARRGGGSKLKNRNKKKAMLQELEKQEYQQERLSQSGGDDQPTSKVSKNLWNQWKLQYFHERKQARFPRAR